MAASATHPLSSRSRASQCFRVFLKVTEQFKRISRLYAPLFSSELAHKVRLLQDKNLKVLRLDWTSFCKEWIAWNLNLVLPASLLSVRLVYRYLLLLLMKPIPNLRLKLRPRRQRFAKFRMLLLAIGDL